MKQMFTKISLSVLFLTFHVFGYSQCIVQQILPTEWVQNNDHHEGQAFTAACTGTIQQVEFQPHSTWECSHSLTFHLIAYSDCEILWTVPNIPITPGVTKQIDLSTGSGSSRDVVINEKYHLGFWADNCTGSQNSRISLDVNNPYPGGSFSLGEMGGFCQEFGNGWDLFFRVGINQNLPLLPVELKSFKASETDEGTVSIDFSSASEWNNDHFEIEHAFESNGKISDFRTIAEVEGQGSSSISHDYQFIHKHPFPGNNYYRLKQMDIDGSFENFGVRAVKIERGQIPFSFHPNPVNDQLHLSLSQWENDGILRIMDMARKEFFAAPVEAETEVTTFDLSDLPAWIYLLEMTNGYERWQERMIKQ